MDSYIYRTGRLFDVAYHWGENVTSNAVVSFDLTDLKILEYGWCPKISEKKK